jgi:hypothetical protein
MGTRRPRTVGYLIAVLLIGLGRAWPMVREGLPGGHRSGRGARGAGAGGVHGASRLGTPMTRGLK